MKTFREAIRNQEFVITAELNLVRESDAAAVVEQATVLGAHVDAIQVPDSPDARVQMTPLAVSSILIQNGIDPIPHLSCRDRNRVALECELLSLGAMGVTSLLLLRGDELPENHRPKIKQVFELGGKKLTWRTAIIVSLAILPSAVTARWLRENLRGSRVPKKVVRRLEQARDPEQEGVAICAELLQQLSGIPGVSGAHLMTPGDPEIISAAIQAAGLRS